jgi:hypothetical protein
VYTDSQLLVDCINGPDPSNPPDWRIKPFTQIIQDSLNISYTVCKIPRTQNQMADSLARRHFIVCFLFSLFLLFHVLILPIFKGARFGMHSNL